MGKYIFRTELTQYPLKSAPLVKLFVTHAVAIKQPDDFVRFILSGYIPDNIIQIFRIYDLFFYFLKVLIHI